MAGQAILRSFLSVREEGPLPPRDGGLLVVCNHLSYVDPAALQVGFRRRIRYLMTEDFYDIVEVVAGEPLMQKPDAFGCKLGGYT